MGVQKNTFKQIIKIRRNSADFAKNGINNSDICEIKMRKFFEKTSFENTVFKKGAFLWHLLKS